MRRAEEAGMGEEEDAFVEIFNLQGAEVGVMFLVDRGRANGDDPARGLVAAMRAAGLERFERMEVGLLATRSQWQEHVLNELARTSGLSNTKFESGLRRYARPPLAAASVVALPVAPRARSSRWPAGAHARPGGPSPSPSAGLCPVSASSPRRSAFSAWRRASPRPSSPPTRMPSPTPPRPLCWPSRR